MAKKKPQKDPGAKSSKRSGKKGGLLPVLAVAAATVVIGIILLSYFGPERIRITKPAIIEKNTKEVSVYFSDEEGLNLKAERRKIKKGPLEAEAREALTTLIDGPENSALGKTIPEGTRLLSLRIKDRTAIADFSSEIVKNHSGGSSGEIQTVYSIVNTIALNFPEVKDVRILVDGKRAETIAGHIDITFPLGPDKKIVKN